VAAGGGELTLATFAAVIDGYSAGNFYPAAFAGLGARVVHVQGPRIMTSMSAPSLDAYAENIVYTDEATVVERLRRYAPVCVLPGQEAAVSMADRLSQLLGLPGNGTSLSAARRDKFEMIEAVRRAGLRCAEQHKSPDPEAIVEWAERRGAYPVVVKPPSSGGTDGVYVCHDPEQVRAAARQVLAMQNIFACANDEALVQSYLAGTEYIVDTVSCDGQSYTCGVWEYEKSLLPSGQNIYDKDILRDPGEEPVPALISYVTEVLEALGIRWGAAHSEVMMTAQGPALVEVGARLNGNMNPAFHDLCLGHNQAALTALAYLRPAEFKRRYGGEVYRRLQPALVYNAPTVLDGVVAGVDQSVVDRISGLKSVYLANVKLEPGSRIRPTVDLLTSPLRVFLTAPSDRQLLSDYERVRSLKDRVYQL
jgi:carbamoylphosphate synthase large subunit